MDRATQEHIKKDVSLINDCANHMGITVTDVIALIRKKVYRPNLPKEKE